MFNSILHLSFFYPPLPHHRIAAASPRRLSPMIGCPGWAPPTRLRPSSVSLWCLAFTPYSISLCVVTQVRRALSVCARHRRAEAGRAPPQVQDSPVPRLPLGHRTVSVRTTLPLHPQRRRRTTTTRQRPTDGAAAAAAAPTGARHVTCNSSPCICSFDGRVSDEPARRYHAAHRGGRLE